jgi:hypothetical protein
MQSGPHSALFYVTQCLRQFFELQRIRLAGFQRLGHVDRLEAGGLCGRNWPIRSISADITVPIMK